MNARLEARLTGRETDNRNPDDVRGYVVTMLLPRSPYRKEATKSERKSA